MKHKNKAIVNIDNNNGKGLHWVLMIKDKNNLLAYDSYGNDIRNYNHHFIKLKNLIQDTKDREQEYEPIETNCGQRALASGKIYKLKGKGAFLKI